MADFLANADVIGGVSVEIRGDTTKLRAAVGEARTIAQQAAASPVTIPITAGGQRIGGTSGIVAPGAVSNGMALAGAGSVVTSRGVGMGDPLADLRAQFAAARASGLPPPSPGSGGMTFGAMMGGIRQSNMARYVAPILAVQSIAGLASAETSRLAMRYSQDPEEQIRLSQQYESSLNSASFGLRGFFRQAIPNWLGFETGTQRDAREAGQTMFEVRRQEAALARSKEFATVSPRLQSETRSSVARAEAMRLMGSGQTLASMNAMLGAEVDEIQTRGTLAMNAAQPNLRPLIGEKASADEAEVRMEHERKVADYIRDRESDIANAKSITLQSSLRISKQTYAADVAAFDDATRQKLASIRDLSAKQSETERRTAMRGALIAGINEEIRSNVSGMRIGGETAILSANNVNDLAERQSLYETRRVGRLQLGSDEERAAYDKETAQLIQAMEVTQGRNRTGRFSERAARRESAMARAGGLDETAAVVGVIAGMGAELRNAPDGERGDIAATQKAELVSLQKELLRPRQYATEGSFRDVAGGPGGKEGRDLVDLGKRIADYLESIDKNTQGGLGP